MTFFDNLKNKLFKEENSGKGKDSQPAEKSKNLQNKIKGLFAKKPDEVEQAVEDLDMSQESQETSRYQRSKQKKPIDTTQPLGKVQAFLSKFTLSPRNPIRRFWRRYHIGKILFIMVAVLVLTVGSYLFYIAKTTNVSDLQDALKATTVIYDKEGNQAGSLSGQKGTYVELDAISDSLENAVIATEDRTFYENSGVNVKRFLLAIVSMGRFGGGSTIKPLVVYAPALASGWSINKDLPNKPIDYNGYTPTNYGGVETEDVPMYQALANSYNIPAVYLFNQIGIQKGISYGQKFGLNFDNVPEELGISLGGGVTASPLQMAQAYATFANGGEMNTAYFITKIENASGDIIATHSKKSKRVISQSVANQMTSMMLGTFSNGSAVNANYTGYTMAGKTGTVQAEFNKDLTSDQWVIGYTPDVVMTTWIGFDKTDESHYLTGASSGTASTIFSYIAADVLPNTPGTEFTVENAYAADGQTLDYTADPNDSRNSSNKSWTDKASDVVNDVKDQASSLWDKITDSFSGLFR